MHHQILQLLGSDNFQRLLANGEASCDSSEGIDHRPVVRLFVPGTGMQWLISEIMPHEPDVAFGLCDLGQGFPELGYVSLAELVDLRRGGFPLVERDRSFVADRTVAAYAGL